MNTQEIISRIRKNLNVCTDELYKISKLFNYNIEKPYLENTRRFKPRTTSAVFKTLDQRLRLRGIYAEIIVNELINNEFISERLKNKVYKILKPIINEIIDDIINVEERDINTVSKSDLINRALTGFSHGSENLGE